MDIGSVLMFSFIWLWNHDTVNPYSIDKHLLDSATKMEMLDAFHVMPDGMMMVVQELDMVLSLDQYKALYMEENHRNHSSSRHKRKAVNDISTKWPKCRIFYEITPSLDTRTDRAIIKQAIDEWEKYSCLLFKESETEENRIQFQSGEMCASAVGMKHGPQALELASGCRTKWVIVHEIGHAVGWFHEHMRPDRDDYLNVHFTAIPPKFRRNYKKYNSDVINTYGIPYDYTSIMHYGDVFPNSMETRDPVYQDQLGQREGFSFKDIKLANVMYDCAKQMHCGEKDCPADGFQFYKSFKGKPRCECWCDSGSVEDPLILCSERKEIVPPPNIVIPPPTKEPPMECMDVRQDCQQMKGMCMSKMKMMMGNCDKTCGFCGKGKDICMDNEAGCEVMAPYCHEPGLSPLSEMCKKSCDMCPTPPDPCEIHKEMLRDHVSNNGFTVPRGYSDMMALLLSLCTMKITGIFIGGQF